MAKRGPFTITTLRPTSAEELRAHCEERDAKAERERLIREWIMKRTSRQNGDMSQRRAIAEKAIN